MVSIDDLDPILERAGLSYYLPSVTFGYLYFEFPDERLYFYAMLVVGLISTFMYVEEEIMDSIKDDLKGEGHHEVTDSHSKTNEEIRSEYAYAEPWLYFETFLLFCWTVSLGVIAFLFACYIDWNKSFWLSALGYLNIIYIFGWFVDKIYGYKYRKYYFDKYVDE